MTSSADDVDSWFAERGFAVQVSPTDDAETVRRSPGVGRHRRGTTMCGWTC